MHSLIGLTTPFALISSYSTPFELKHALELSRCTRLFVNARLIPAVLPVAKKVGIPSNRIYVLGGYVKGQKSFSDMIGDAQTNNMPFVSTRPAVKDTLAYLIFSSGTTGLPKGPCHVQCPCLGRASYLHNSWCSGHDISWKYKICHHASCHRLTSDFRSIYG